MDKNLLTAEQYISHHNLDVYLRDAVAQMLQCKSDNIKLTPASFLHDYFSSVKQGTHTVFREYAFISATARNRKSFVFNFWSSFQHLSTQGDLLNIEDYYSLTCLHCHDFNYDILRKTVRTILTDDASDCLLTFIDFVYAFQLNFYYEQFCNKCLEIFSDIQEHLSPNTSESLRGSETQKSEGVSANYFLHRIEQECYNKNPRFAVPPEEVVRTLLSSVPKISYYGFMVSLTKSENLNKSINVLPPVRPASGMHKISS